MVLTLWYSLFYDYKMAAELTHLKNVRAGHKGILTKKLRDLEDALKDTPPDRDALEQFKASLEEKLNILRNHSDQIVAKLQDATEIATEIEGNEATVDSVRAALCKINRSLGPTPTVSASPANSKVNFPKLSIPPHLKVITQNGCLSGTYMRQLYMIIPTYLISTSLPTYSLF